MAVKKHDYETDNGIAAAVILASPDRHPRYLLDWAQRWQARVERERTGQLELFRYQQYQH